MSSPLKPLFDKLPAPFRNKYFIAIVLFVAWLIFFDKHDVLTQFKLQQTHQQLEEDKAYYEEEIEKAWEDKRALEIDKEKFAREHYNMKKRDEDVFLIVPEKD